MKIDHICFDVDDTLYPPSEDFIREKKVKHRARLIKLLKEKGPEAVARAEAILSEYNVKKKLDEITVGDYNWILDEFASKSNSGLYKKLGVDHKWVERDVFYTDRGVVKYEPAVVDTLRELRRRGFELSIFTNTSYGSAANVLTNMGLTPRMQEEIFAIGPNTNPFAEENIGETRKSLEAALKQGTITQEDKDYMIKQYDAKVDFLRRGVNILSAEDKGDYKKDATGGFERIAQCVSVSPERILYVGDSLKKDLKPAHNTGFSTCHVSWKEAIEKPEYVDMAVGKLMEIEAKLR